MSSTEHFRKLRCPKCGSDAVQVTEHRKDGYRCECYCGAVYKSKSVAAGAAYLKFLSNNP